MILILINRLGVPLPPRPIRWCPGAHLCGFLLMSCFAFLMILFSSVLMSCLWSPPSSVTVHPYLISFLVNLPTLLYKSYTIPFVFVNLLSMHVPDVPSSYSISLLDSLFVFLSLASTLLRSFTFLDQHPSFDPCLPLLPPYLSIVFLAPGSTPLCPVDESSWFIMSDTCH